MRKAQARPGRNTKLMMFVYRHADYRSSPMAPKGRWRWIRRRSRRRRSQVQYRRFTAALTEARAVVLELRCLIVEVRRLIAAITVALISFRLLISVLNFVF